MKHVSLFQRARARRARTRARHPKGSSAPLLLGGAHPRSLRFVLLAVALAANAGLAASAQDTTLGPSSFEELAKAAQRAQKQNDWNTAAVRYKEALKIRPDIPELHANLGLMDYELGEAENADAEFQTALKLNPSLFVPNLFLGIEYLKRDEPSTALRYLSRAAQLNSRDFEVNLSLGRAYAALNKDSEAISAYLNAVTFHPGSEDGWYGLGTSYLNRAESLSDLLAKRYRNSAAFRALSASYFDDQGKYAQAISEYRAIVSSPDAPACSHTRLGFVLIHNGQFAQAADEFNPDLRAPNCAALAHIGLARIQVRSGNTSAARTMLGQAAKDDLPEFHANAFEFWKDLPPETLPAIDQELNHDTRLREVLKDNRSAEFGDSEQSDGSAKGAVDSNPVMRVSLPSDLAHAYMSGHYRTVASSGDKSVASGVLSPNTLYWAVRANQQLGISALTQAATVAPGSIRIHLLLGDLYRRRGQLLRARQEYQEALKLENNSVAALLGLATTLYLNGDSGPAEEVAKQALSRNPDDPESRLLMAEILLAQHRYEDAYRYVEPVPNGKPDLLAEIHGVRGTIFAATRHPREAIAELKKAVDNDPQGNLTYILARQYQLLGDKQSADLAFRRSNLLRQKFNARATYKFEGLEQN